MHFEEDNEMAAVRLAAGSPVIGFRGGPEYSSEGPGQEALTRWV
jgi:hypothetical protein